MADKLRQKFKEVNLPGVSNPPSSAAPSAASRGQLPSYQRQSPGCNDRPGTNNRQSQARDKDKDIPGRLSPAFNSASDGEGVLSNPASDAEGVRSGSDGEGMKATSHVRRRSNSHSYGDEEMFLSPSPQPSFGLLDEEGMVDVDCFGSGGFPGVGIKFRGGAAFDQAVEHSGQDATHGQIGDIAFDPANDDKLVHYFGKGD